MSVVFVSVAAMSMRRTAALLTAFVLVASTLAAAALAVTSPVATPPAGAAEVGDPTWLVTEHLMPSGAAEPMDVAVDAHGVVWTTLMADNQVASYDPATDSLSFHNVPTPDSRPLGIATGPDDTIWFVEEAASKLGVISGDLITEIPVPGDGAAPTSVTLGPDGAMWFTDPGLGRIGRAEASGELTFFQLDDPQAAPVDIVAGPDGALWYPLYQAGTLGRITTDGTMTTVDLEDPEGEPVAIATTTDGRLAVAVKAQERIALVTTAGEVETYQLPLYHLLGSPVLTPFGVAAGPEGSVWVSAVDPGSGSGYVVQMDATGATSNHRLRMGAPSPGTVDVPIGVAQGAGGTVWFTQPTSNRLAQLSFDTSAFTSFPLPDGAMGADVVVDDAGDVWFSDYWAGRIGVLDVRSGETTLYDIPTPESHPIGLAFDGDGHLWFAEYGANKIGRLDPSQPGGDIQEYEIPTPGTEPVSITLGPDGGMWFSEESGGKVGNIDHTGTIEEHALGDDVIGLEDIVVGPDGALWVVTHKQGSLVGQEPSGLTRLTTEGEVSYFPFSVNGLDPQSIVSSGGELWWGAIEGAMAGTMTTTGDTTSQNLNHGVRGMTEGPDGNVWYGGFVSGRLGKAISDTRYVELLPGTDSTTPAGECDDTEQLPVGCEVVYDVAAGTRGDLWFTSNSNALLRLQVTPSPDPHCTTAPFVDVPVDSPFCGEIAWMAAEGISEGYPGGLYKPDLAVTRMAAAAFLYRLEGSPDGPDPTCSAPPFADVPEDHPFCGEIAWMASEGISTGYDDDTFRPEADVTRMASAAFLYRLANGSQPPAACATPPFTDVPVDHPFCGEIAWMADEGISRGYDDGTFHPDAVVTRMAISAFLYRYDVAVAPA